MTQLKEKSEMNSDGTWSRAQGGTELMNKALYERVDNDLLEQFNIIKSRVRDVSANKKNILWLHDTWNDPESQHLKQENLRNRFEKLVFVSNYQQMTYNMGLGVPYENGIVIKNAIDPIEIEQKNKGDDVIRLIYHTTPHRGLQLLIPVVNELSKVWGDRIHLDVYSSFAAYGWEDRDEPYKPLFEAANEHPNMTYHGFQPNDVVRDALKKAHIYAYPCIWVETSCISMIEAMSAGCEVVHPNLGALPETAGNWTTMYNFYEDLQHHANQFANVLNTAISKRFDEQTKMKLEFQKNYVDNFFNWDLRSKEWTSLLQGLSQQ